MASKGTNAGKILILDADAARARNFAGRLGYLNYEAIVPDGDRLDAVDADTLAVVVGKLDDTLGDAAVAYRDAHRETPFICFPEATGTRPELAEADSWMLQLPLRRAQLKRLLKRAERYRGADRRQRLTGQASSIRRVRTLIEQVADFDTTVLVTGQSGTGKELVARTIHDLSDRADKPFVPINCGAIPADLLESELFGHKKGAFTGAIADRTGRFELAEGGTLFLDEIGDMSLDMQVKLLRVLQERCFERVGSGETRACNVRIIAATHKDLPAAVSSGEFREDLFYRLNVFPIEMPPLYKRVSDLPQLLDELFMTHAGDGTTQFRVSAEAIRALAAYRWPGNIRELSNLVERLVITKPDGIIDVGDLPPKFREAQPAAPGQLNPVCAAMQLTESNLKDTLQRVEQDLIGQAMEASNGVVARAARLLKLRRTTLVEKIGKYNIA